MHDDQLDIDDDVVRRLIADQFPAWSAEPLVRVPGSGTVNAIFRIGDALAARFPLRGSDAATAARLRTEAAAMEELAEVSPFPVPRHVALGRPGGGYPLPWSVQTWLDGVIATPDSVSASDSFVRDLAEFIAALRAADTRGRRFAGGGRGGDLRTHDDWVAECIRESAADFDAAALTRLWGGFRELPRTSPDAMVHGDLIPANVLVREGRLAGVLDGGGFGPADPALELVCAWHLLDLERRAVLRATLDVDDVEWKRGAAWAFQQAMGLVWYYRESNPVMRDLGRSTLGRILADAEITGDAVSVNR
jgi:aminoglycoside phosphotransferase (APT) family kinase protein